MSDTQIVRADEPAQAIGLASEYTTRDVLAHLVKIQDVMKAAMRDGTHYGLIPGCGTKPSLLKPGAELLAMLFRLRPSYSVAVTELGSGHREYVVTCTLTHIPSGREWGAGTGSCSTMESKYRYRAGERVCPKCRKAAIIKGKEEFGGGWICFAKKGGCGEKWADGAAAIESQATGRAENPDIADSYNTVLKMAQKRAFVGVVLGATSASDCFTQDVEDLAQAEFEAAKPVAVHAPAPAPVPPPAAKPAKAAAPAPHIVAFCAEKKRLDVSDAQAKSVLAEFGLKSIRDIPEAAAAAITERMRVLAGAGSPLAEDREPGSDG